MSQPQTTPEVVVPEPPTKIGKRNKEWSTSEHGIGKGECILFSLPPALFHPYHSTHN